MATIDRPENYEENPKINHLKMEVQFALIKMFGEIDRCQNINELKYRLKQSITLNYGKDDIFNELIGESNPFKQHDS